MVPLVILLEMCHTDASAYGIKLSQSCHTSFHLFDLRNAVVPLTTPSASHDAGAGAIAAT